MNIYLDIDGVLLTKNGDLAEGLEDFLNYVTEHHNCYWLTTHCKGDNSRVFEIFRVRVTSEMFEIIKRIHPTNWLTWKTEAIDFSKDFRWFDDNLMIKEKEVLMSYDCLDKIIKVDLVSNPYQLKEITHERIF